jgi:isoleucyl-tRNA synthetase
MTASPRARLIGPKYGSEVQLIIQAAKAGNFQLLDDGQIKVSVVTAGLEKEFYLLPEEVEVGYQGKEGFGVESAAGIVVALDLKITSELALEGQARDIVRLIQEMRKEANYKVEDRIKIALKGCPEILKKYSAYIQKETLGVGIEEKELLEFDLTKKMDGITVWIKKG